MNVLDKSAIRECTSCQMCAAVCPKDAISIKLNEDGFYRPYVDDGLCIDCGICVKTCYKFDEKLSPTTTENLSRMRLYSASAIDNNVIKETTSGGVADLLARELCEQGFSCIGVIYDSRKSRAEHIIADSEDDILAFRGSKYIQSYTVDAFKIFVKQYKKKRYAIFGTPCQIYAIHKFLTINKCRENFILVDIFCHGCPSMLAWKKYHDKLNKTLCDTTYCKINFRSKIKSWGWYNISVYKDKEVLFSSSPQHDEFYTLFFSDQILNDSCYHCHFRSSLEYTDIRVGDFWGKAYADNKRGVSAVCLVTEHARRLFDSIKPKVNYKIHPFTDLLPYQSWNKKYSPNSEIRSEIFKSLRSSNLQIDDSVRILYSHQGLKDKIKRYIKYIAFYSPFDFWFYLKRFF